MKTLIASTAIALTALAGAAAASPQLAASAQVKLDRYGVEVDADTLSEAQLVQIKSVDADESGSVASVRAQLLSALH